MFNFDKFRPELTEKSRNVYEAIKNDGILMSHIAWAEKNRTFSCGNVQINNYQTMIESAVEEKAEELGIRLNLMEKMNVRTNLICDYGNKNQSR